MTSRVIIFVGPELSPINTQELLAQFPNGNVSIVSISTKEDIVSHIRDVKVANGDKLNIILLFKGDEQSNILLKDAQSALKSTALVDVIQGILNEKFIKKPKISTRILCRVKTENIDDLDKANRPISGICSSNHQVVVTNTHNISAGSLKADSVDMIILNLLLTIYSQQLDLLLFMDKKTH
jgi:hypothetical protein